MEVTVKPHYFLRKYAPVGDYKVPFSVDIGDNTTVNDLISILGMEDEERRIVFVDNKRSNDLVILKEGAVVKIFPAIIGG